MQATGSLARSMGCIGRTHLHQVTHQRGLRCSCAPRYNPQNTDNPVVGDPMAMVVPSPKFSPQDTVKVQLEACAANDKPWANHGLQTTYEFAEDAGSMEKSWYFGFLKDLYHQDHWNGAFNTRLGALVNCQSWSILGQRDDTPEPGMVQVDVSVVDSTGKDAGVFTFTLVQRQLGSKKGCWMTKSLIKKAA